MGIYFLTFAALLPAIALGAYIYKKDKNEKEPKSLLIKLLLLGALICFPAGSAEELLLGLTDVIFGHSVYGISAFIYNLIVNFIDIALVEEGLKLLVLYITTKNSRSFNSLFDGLIYAVFVALGFAGLENIMYVSEFGFRVAVLRAVTAVPAHTFFGVMMGYQYSMWHMYKKAGAKEKELQVHGVIPSGPDSFPAGRYLLLSLIIPVAAHGLYDFTASSNSLISNIVFYGFLIFMYAFCFSRIHKISKNDINDERYTDWLLIRKYPQVAQILNERRKSFNGNANQNAEFYRNPDGTVTYTWPGGARYHGMWSNGTMNGYGTFIYNNNFCLRYDGNFINGKFEGYGVLQYKNGSSYEGYWLRGMKHGQGRIRYPDGRIQEGVWEYDIIVNYRFHK